MRWRIERSVRYLYYLILKNKPKVKLDYLSPVGLAPVRRGDVVEYTILDGGSTWGMSYLRNINKDHLIGVASEDIEIGSSGMIWER
jgi:hypothetical protein